MKKQQQVKGQSIAAVMQDRTAQATIEVRALLWKDAPADDIATAALTGAVQPADVDKIQLEVEAAKGELEALQVFDIPALNASVKKNKTALEKVNAEYERIEISQDEIARAYDQSVEDLRLAKSAFTNAANSVTAGRLPADRVPKAVSDLAAIEKLDTERRTLDSNCKKLSIEMAHLDSKILFATAQAERVDQFSKEEMVNTPGGLVKKTEYFKSQLKTLKGQMSEAVKYIDAAKLQMQELETKAENLRKAAIL